MKKTCQHSWLFHSPRTLIIGALISGAYLVVLSLITSVIADSGPILAQENAATAQALPPGEVFAVNAGGSATDGYSADTNYTFGNVYSNNSQQVSTQSASYPAPAAVYQDEREGDHFSYTFPGLTPNSTYVVILHFAELYWSRPGQRQFNVSINGTPELSNFDIVAEVGGPFQAVDELFFVKSDAKGTIEINFSKGAVDQPMINAIEVRSNAG